jgi:hypothetical protein
LNFYRESDRGDKWKDRRAEINQEGKKLDMAFIVIVISAF